MVKKGMLCILCCMICIMTGCWRQTDLSDEHMEERSTSVSETEKAKEEEEEETMAHPDPLNHYFDRARNQKPSEMDVKSITTGMSMSEVVDKIGKPHEGGPTSGIPSFTWEDREGNQYYICFMLNSNAPNDCEYAERIMKYGVTVSAALPFP